MSETHEQSRLIATAMNEGSPQARAQFIRTLGGGLKEFGFITVGRHGIDLGLIRDAYRLFALDTTPPKPGLVRRGPGLGAPVVGEIFRISPAGLGTFLAALPAPMALTSVELSDGRTTVGFSCTHDAVNGAADITDYGGWAAYLSR